MLASVTTVLLTAYIAVRLWLLLLSITFCLVCVCIVLIYGE